MTADVTSRGGFICPEVSALEDDLLVKGGFNSDSGASRERLYYELDAIKNGSAKYIDEGLAQRKALRGKGLFTYQEMGEGSLKALRGDCYGLQKNEWSLIFF